MRRLLRFLFGCRHGRISMPVTWTDRGVVVTTVLCQECGARLGYDWARMRVVKKL